MHITPHSARSGHARIPRGWPVRLAVLARMAAIGVLGLQLSGFSAGVQAATQYTFYLDDNYTTSAAIYDEWGYLIRTLSRGDTLGSGWHTLSWDNLDDSGYPADASYYDETGALQPVHYQLKLLRHQIHYGWEGVIGNSSASFTGPGIFKAINAPLSLAAAGNNVYFAVGYNEQQVAGHGFNTANPQVDTPPLVWRSDMANGFDAFVALSLVASDGNRLYWANTTGGFGGSNTSFVLASDLSTRSFSNWPNGQTLCLNYRGGYTAPVPGLAYIHWCYPGQYYAGVIDVGDAAGAPTGIAVQKNGPLLAVAHGTQGQVRLFDKTSGALLGSFAIPVSAAGAQKNQIAMAPNGDLWVIVGTSLQRYSNLGDFNNGPTLATTVLGWSHPLAVTVHPTDDDQVLVADGGSSQQVRAMDRNGAPLWTYGRAGGYGSDPAVSPDKLWFQSSPTTETAALLLLADGSFWVSDTANVRLLHIGADHGYIEQVAYRPISYVATVDPNNPKRVFSNFMEYEVDTSAPLQAGLSPSWRLVRNWLAGFPSSTDPNALNSGFGGLHTVVTLSNGRTYGLAVVTAAGYDNQLVELPASGPARDTGITLKTACPGATSPCVLYENGELGYPVTPAPKPSGNTEFQSIYRKALSGFDASGNPQWAAPRLLAQVPVNPSPYYAGMPYYHGAWSGILGPRFPLTGKQRVVFFDQSVTGNEGLHLGAVDEGGGWYTWQASPSGPLDGKGRFQTKASDASLNYGGNTVWASGEHIVYGYHGEGYTDPVSHHVGQANQFMHFSQDGLFIGQFGTPMLITGNAPDDPGVGQAGNAFGNILVPAGADALYWYHNDESSHGGVHRWRISNLSSMVVLDGSGVLDASVTLQLPAAARSATAVNTLASASTLRAGQGLTLTASVAGVSGSSPTPSGAVQFFDQGVAWQAPVALVNGSAQLAISNPTLGTHTYTASYAGDGYHQGSGSAGVTVVVGAAGAGEGDGDVPLPPWAGLVLGTGLLGAAARKPSAAARASQPL